MSPKVYDLAIVGAGPTGLFGTFYAGMRDLIANGFAQATIGVNMANKFIYPKSRVFPGHSSQKKGIKYAPTPVGHKE